MVRYVSDLHMYCLPKHTSYVCVYLHCMHCIVCVSAYFHKDCPHTEYWDIKCTNQFGSQRVSALLLLLRTYIHHADYKYVDMCVYLYIHMCSCNVFNAGHSVSLPAIFLLRLECVCKSTSTSHRARLEITLES